VSYAIEGVSSTQKTKLYLHENIVFLFLFFYIPPSLRKWAPRAGLRKWQTDGIAVRGGLGVKFFQSFRKIL
jgi:hypothetical protein